MILVTCAFAADQPVAESPWQWKCKVAAFIQSTASHNAVGSRDPAIAGTVDNLSYQLSGESSAVWKVDKDRFEQKVETTFGQIKTADRNAWVENADSVRYDATYERTLTAPRFVYGNLDGESVYTGKEPERTPFDPLIAKLSIGYGHRYEGLLPEKDALIGRVGVYVRKRWERDAPSYQVDAETGPEWYLRYERQQNADVSYFAQYDGYSEFSDHKHVTNLIQAGLSVKLAKLLTVEIKTRAYFENRPREAEPQTIGYSEWAVRQEVLAGLVWETGTD